MFIGYIPVLKLNNVYIFMVPLKNFILISEVSILYEILAKLYIQFV